MTRKNIEFVPDCITRSMPGNLKFGQFSMVQNMRAKGRSLDQRGGQAYLHSTADTGNYPRRIFQFSKGKITERHTYAQMSDGDLLEATNSPPTVTTGAFGSAVHAGSSGQIPASFAVVDDILVYCNGADMPQVYCGDDYPVDSCVVYDSGDTEPPDLPTEDTKDYSIEAADSDTSRVVVLDSLHAWNAGSDGEYGAIYVKTKTPYVKAFNFVVEAANANASVMSLHKWNGSWTSVSITDGTADTGATLAHDGAVTFTAPTDVIPKYMFGENGFWWRFSFSADLDAEVEVSYITFDSEWGPIQNVWDGVPVDAIEVQYYQASPGTYETYSADYIDIGPMTSSDWVYFATKDPIEAFWVGVGEYPNETAATAINNFGYWTGTTWSDAAPSNDGTSGLLNSGRVYVGRQASAQPLQFRDNQNYMYWWRFSVDKTLSAGDEDEIIISIQYQPYFDISDFGSAGRVCQAWKDRLLLTFNKWSKDGYVSAKNNIMAFNGNDFTVLQPGDGRANPTTAILPWHNELLFFQEEKGQDGGCVTLFQGYSAPTFGKLILSTKLGTPSVNSVCVVEGAFTSLNTQRPVTKLAYFMSKTGFFICDGQSFAGVSDNIQNYFDPEESECIRNGYEQYHFLGHDTSSNCLIAGLVSGASATAPNVFPVLHLSSGNTWTFDDREQPLTCFAEVEAGSGNVPTIQIGGASGYVMRLNTGLNDVSAAIDAYATVELDWWGIRASLERLFFRCNVNTGNVTITPYENGVAKTALTKAMTAEKTNETVRRHLLNIKHTDEHLSLKFQNAVASQTLSLVDLMIEYQEAKDQ